MQIAIFFSHPTQHHSPMFRALAATGEVNLHVFYYHPGLTSPTGGYDKGFEKVFQWDVPLLGGYCYTFLPFRYNAGISPFTLSRGLIANLKSRPWDAVFVAGYVHLNNWLVAFTANYLKIPVIYFSDSNLLSPMNLWKKSLKNLLVRAFFKSISGFLYIGDHNYEFYRHYGVPPNKLFWWPYPVDIKRFVRAASAITQKTLASLLQRYDIPPDARVLLFVGKLIDRKRPLDLVQALAEITIDQEVVALFVGDGPLWEAVQRVGGSKVRIAGFVNQTDMPVHLSLGDILVMPSEHDPHPLVVTEAAALGIPAIISDRCGCYGPRDILRPEENGYVYPCGHIRALAEKIAELLNDEALRQRFSSRARELALTQDCTVAAQAIIDAVKAVKNQHE